MVRASRFLCENTVGLVPARWPPPSCSTPVPAEPGCALEAPKGNQIQWVWSGTLELAFLVILIIQVSLMFSYVREQLF